MGKDLLNYVDQWERDTASKVGLHMKTDESCGNVYGIEIRFNPSKYYSDILDYNKICRDAKWSSNGAFFVSSSEDELKAGMISVKVNFVSSSYNDNNAITVLKGILDNLNT